MPLYAAYGSNMDPRRMLERCPHSPLETTGWLTGWRLTFGGEEHGWDGALPTIVQDPLEQVFVAVYDVSREDESALDSWEGADSGLYRKTKVRIFTLTGEMVVWTYVLDAYEGGLPSASYVGVLAGAEAADADDYVLRCAPAVDRSTSSVTWLPLACVERVPHSPLSRRQAWLTRATLTVRAQRKTAGTVALADD